MSETLSQSSIGCTHYVLFLFLGLGFKKSVFIYLFLLKVMFSRLLLEVGARMYRLSYGLA